MADVANFVKKRVKATTDFWSLTHSAILSDS